MSGFLSAVTLRGEHVVLEPLGMVHAAGLAEAVTDGDIHRLWFTGAPAPEEVVGYIAKAQAQAEAGTAQAFAVRRVADGQVLGSTRFCHADAENRRLEIGYTWYAKRAQRTAVNTECKYLLLQHAFETLEAIAVELRTHWLNHRSRAAIERLGAKCDGVLRNHRRTPDGSLRDTVVYSIIAGEWPAVRQHLTFKLQQDFSS
ncbi:GNAT family protein [Oleiagrimonas sp. C23AA]|uniref:GNAT family N-acetyltransferase n=1 Tax=Oleiagrimonas sp. C23AA TaxID=2719047 RepID=UPI00141F0D84|nr:GNAT family protein [Oleiagrimonas sp. C23AA]NII10230.1 GNAT family N-acetyltransferase [Oleiagrimonas sp. C23AA]